jgi:Ca-activated chloride channel homolog
MRVHQILRQILRQIMRQLTTTWLWSLAAVASLAVSAWAQVDVQKLNDQGAASAGDSALRFDTRVVSLTVTVTDKQGRHLPNLDQRAFTVFEDDVAQEISYFNHVDAPASVAIVFDLSGSMQDKRIANAKLALERFVANCHPDDDFSLIGFNDEAWLALDRTRDSQQLIRQFNDVKPIGGTALFDAVAVGLQHLERARHKRRVLIIISDGEDNGSRTTLAKVKRQAQESAALIYGVGVSTFLQRHLYGSGSWLLNELAAQSGGKAYFPGDGEEMSEAFEKIALELRQQYSIGYTPTSFSADGKWRRVKVKVTPPAETPKIVVHSRPGYYAKPNRGARTMGVGPEP